MRRPYWRLQWGHDDEVVEEAPELSPEEAHLLLQWGHDDEVVEELPPVGLPTSVTYCFNGATTMRSWKSTVSSDHCPRSEVASMGPRR